MATTEQLLRLSTRGAIVRMVNDENGTFFDGSPRGPLTISPPLSLGGLRTEVEIGIRRQLAGDDLLPFPGELVFRYNRLDIEFNLGGKLSGFRPPMPTSTQVLLDEMTRRTGIRFETEDFVLEDINRSNGAPYVLRAKPESLRWVGEIAVVLIDLVDLDTFIEGGLPSSPQSLSFNSPVARTPDNQPYLNATAHHRALEAVPLNSVVDSIDHPLFHFLQKTVGPLGTYLRDSVSPWVVELEPSSYNAQGAVLLSRDTILDNLNPLVPTAHRMARVRLGHLDAAYGDKDLLIPYATVNFDDSQFTPMARFKVSAVVNASNGTPWNRYLNSLPAPSVITSLPNGLDLRFSGPDEWVANASTPGPTNLYNAVVQYNGTPRAYDMRSFHPECNRVIVFTVSDHNTAYQGNLTFHYRAPIMIDEDMPDAVLGSTYVHDFNPSEGVGPYTMTRVSGDLGPNHVLGADNRVSGPTNALGRFSVVYDVQDSSGVTVRYSLSYRAVVGPIVVSGTPPAATAGEPYEFTFTVSGGVPDYSYQLFDTGGGSGLSLPNPFVPRVVGTLSGSPGSRSYALEVTDSQGTITTLSFSINVE